MSGLQPIGCPTRIPFLGAAALTTNLFRTPRQYRTQTSEARILYLFTDEMFRLFKTGIGMCPGRARCRGE